MLKLQGKNQIENSHSIRYNTHRSLNEVENGMNPNVNYVKCKKCGVLSPRENMEYVSFFPYCVCVCVCKECADKYSKRKIFPVQMLERDDKK